MRLCDLNKEQEKALLDIVRAAESVDADLSCNADRRGLEDLYVRIESSRIRCLLQSLQRFKALTAPDQGKKS